MPEVCRMMPYLAVELPTCLKSEEETGGTEHPQ